MPLSIGSKAPEFALPTIAADGPQILSLADFRGKSNVVLLFFPMAYTRVCAEELCSVSLGLTDYANLDAVVLGISGDNPFAQAEWAKKEGITFPLLSDYEHAVTKSYGVDYQSFLPQKNLPMSGVAKRSAFVIDKAGLVRHSEVKENPGDLPDFDAIKSALKAL